MSTYRALVEYDGTRYSGFQTQVAKLTIQGELERSLQQLTQQRVRVEGAGRTDAGVHALGQVISFSADWSHGVADLERAMNATLPEDISVRGLALADPGFHARFNARSREYVYRVLNSSTRSPLVERFCHRVAQPLDVAAMNRAAASLLGTHDFAAFGQPPVGENTVRDVRRAVWRTGSPGATLAGADDEAGRLLTLDIEANAFLRGMVRRMAGTLLEVGAGRLEVSGFADILASGDISRAAAPAPARGLVLWRVNYAV